MFRKVRFESNFVYTADKKKDYIGKIVSGNNQFIEIEQSNGKHIYASFGIVDSFGNFYTLCGNTICGKSCIGIPPHGIYCRFNSVSMAMGAFYVKD